MNLEQKESSSNNKNKKFYRIIIAILVIALIALALMYLYFFKDKNGRIIIPSLNGSGTIKFHYAVYGPGEGKYPRFKKPMAVAADKAGNMYVTDSGHNRVVVFDNKGKFKFEFGALGIAGNQSKAKWQPGTFYFPYGIDIDQDTGNIFIADMLNKRIQVFNSAGKFIDWFPKKPFQGMAGQIYPTEIAVEKGRVYVCNPYQIVIFDTKGKFLKEFGMPGSKQGQLDRPNGIDIGEDGTIYVSDCNNIRLQAFTTAGKPKWSFGKKVGVTNNEGREFGLPRNISVGPDGNIYLADAFHFNIKVFSPKGKKLAEMGKRGGANGTFNYPNGIAVREDKVIYVVDKENHRVQAIELDGFVIDDSRS